MGNKQGAKLRSRDREELRRRTNFSPNEIAEWYKAFQKDCPNGYLTVVDFQNIYSQYFPAGDPTYFATQMFHNFDLDHDGMVTFRDFIIALYITSRQSAKDKINWAFDFYDTDHDGFISEIEMTQIVTAIYQMVGESMQMPEDESTPEKRVKKIFAQYDRDRDGKLSREEFVQSSLMDPMVARLLNSNAGAATGTTTTTSRMNPSGTTHLRS